jgi:L-asparaginase/Glu-tRNA(Gln) amidotransferase subunit D
VLVQEQRIFAARDVQKGDARPGGYVVTGGHGGILGAVGHEGVATITYLPARRHTWQSEVNLARLPAGVKNASGELLADAIPKVAIVKEANYYAEGDDPEDDADLKALIERNARRYPLSGFVLEGHSPYGTTASVSRTRLLREAAGRGMPVVIVGRGNNEGFTAPQGPFIGGRNLTATKARLLLMACLLRFGAPAKGDPQKLLAQYQAVFDTH